MLCVKLSIMFGTHLKYEYTSPPNVIT